MIALLIWFVVLILIFAIVRMLLNYIPMEAGMRRIIDVILIIILLLILLYWLVPALPPLPRRP